MQFEFIDYDGKYPQLCSGHLRFMSDGKKYAGYIWLLSGGRSWFDEYLNWHLTEGPWKEVSGPLFEVYPKFLEHKTELLKMINENVPHGCSGGCV